MSRKVDLNAPRNIQNDYKKSRNNHSFSHESSPRNTTANDAIKNATENNSSNTSSREQMVREKGLRMAVLPKLSAGVASNKIKAIIKFLSPTVRVAVLAIIGITLVGLMLFVVLFSDASATGLDDYISLMESCSTITVVDTDCDTDGNNCTHKYDGEVNFEDYIAGVVAGIGDGAGNQEFYKVISVMARTYFLANADSNCNVLGNDFFMKYIDIADANDKNMIKNAVSDTSKIVLINSDNELLSVDYSMACVVNSDSNNYYVRYGIGDDNYQSIAVSFDNSSPIYRGKLSSLYSSVDKTNENYENRACPIGNNSSGLSLIGALYLAKNDNYNYSDILSYYYGEVSETKAEGAFVGNAVDGFTNPLSNIYMCTSSYGCRIHPISGGYRYHSGIDIPVVEGTLVYAAKAGKISAVRTDVPGYLAGSYGNYVDIDHMDGTMTRYAHLKYGGVMVSVGMMVNQGQAIALSGNTGGSTGPHLHYEVHVNGAPTDPYNYLDTTVIGDASSCNYGRSVAASYCGR